jgi:hypothetical protein
MLILVICDFGKNTFLHIPLKMSRLLMLGIVDLLGMVTVGLQTVHVIVSYTLAAVP